MSDWSNDLGEALASGDTERMKTTLARVPKDVLQRALPHLDELARASAAEERWEDALACYDQLLLVAPDDVARLADRAGIHLRLNRHADALADAQRVVELAPERSSGHRLQAEIHDAAQAFSLALAAYREVLRIEPGDEQATQRVRFLETELGKDALLKQALDPNAPEESLRIELPSPAPVTFDPALFDDPGIPASFESFRVDGVRQLLWRYSAQQSPRNVLSRLDDPQWLAAWDAALATTAGNRLLFSGSELGVLALRALQHGAEHALCVESFPLDARITTGMVQKHFLGPWHAQHGAAIQGWTEDERRESFEAFASAIDIVSPDDPEAAAAGRDTLIFPRIDHTLLGTGIVKAVRRFTADGRSARVLPARATVYAMAIQWAYAASPFALAPVNKLRWSLYPQALDLGPEFWTPLTEPVRVGDIDFADFSETQWDVELPVVADGTVDAVLFWFELDLGASTLSNAPGSALHCIRPAVQYADPIEVSSGQTLPVSVGVEETRLRFRTTPPATRVRAHGLPSWYVPMLGDPHRNTAYQTAIAKAVASGTPETVLDIGAGCGLLSMMAASAGAGRVMGCETHPAIFEAGNEIIRLNRLDDRIDIVNKDCRAMKVPEDLPRRADLAVFELFDCSLIGEGVLHFLAYAREHLLTADATYVPASAKIRAMVIEYRLDSVLGIDANLLNPYRFSPAFINVDAAQLAYRPLSAPFDVFSFDFAQAGPAPETRELTIPAIAPGTAGAVMFWFDAQLDGDTRLSNAPDADKPLHWKQGLQFLPEVRVDSAMSLPLLAEHNGSGLKFQWQRGVLPEEAISQLPRFDPRWLAASTQLEQQTQGLLQHCAQHPDEHAKVAEIAKRFAIDPASHGLDPVIAQRFAAMFFGG